MSCRPRQWLPSSTYHCQINPEELIVGMLAKVSAGTYFPEMGIFGWN